MHLLDLTLDTPAANLALDEALLEQCAAGTLGSVLRFWQLPTPLVVMGRASRLADEVHYDVCREADVPVLRRVSGGLTIVTGPGCLMYTVVAPIATEQTDVEQVHRQVLKPIVAALRSIGLPVSRAGTSDLALDQPVGPPRKVSGNSLRLSRRAYLYHGTLLYDFDLPLVPRLLKQPPRAPDYRDHRPHADFVANMPTTADKLKTAIANQWGATEELTNWPAPRTDELVAEKYSRDDWNLSR